MGTSAKSSKLRVLLPLGRDCDRILTPAALEFVTDLHTRFDDRRLELLAARAERQKFR
jgi:malate synthase